MKETTQHEAWKHLTSTSGASHRPSNPERTLPRPACSNEKKRCLREDFIHPTDDGRNPAPVDMLNIPLFYRVLYISGGAGFLPSTLLIFLYKWISVFFNTPQVRRLDGFIHLPIMRFGSETGGFIWNGNSHHMGVSINGGTPKTPQNDHF